jgi:acylphosphatase
MQYNARRWFVSGRVQGVGFRWFVQDSASRLGLRGWVRNEDDGRVQVYAVGAPELLNQLAGLLHRGPRMADVRGVEEQEAAVQQLNSFRSE